MTPEKLVEATGCSAELAAKWAEPITMAMEEFGVSTPQRQAMFLANIAHESGLFRWVRELWGPTAAQVTYEGRASLGNTQPGDGRRFLGRGLIQVTGRLNYMRLTARLGIDFVNHPELLEEPINAARSAGDYWQDRGLNERADTGDFDGVCDVINRGHKTRPVGDTNGYLERRNLWLRCNRALGLS